MAETISFAFLPVPPSFEEAERRNMNGESFGNIEIVQSYAAWFRGGKRDADV